MVETPFSCWVCVTSSTSPPFNFQSPIFPPSAAFFTMELLNTEWTTRKSDVSKPELSQGQKEFLHHDSSDYDSTDDEEAIARGENMRRRILGAVKINDKAREISSTLGSKVCSSRLLLARFLLPSGINRILSVDSGQPVGVA